MDQPKGVAFFDGRSQRRMLLIRDDDNDYDGWICYQHQDGQWVTLRKATGRDLLAMQQATRDQTMDTEDVMVRPDKDILDRIVSLGEDPSADMFGVERSRLLESLPWETAKGFLGQDSTHTEEGWEVERTRTRKSVIAQIRGYLEFAWGKANQCRGLSAQRSMSHFKGLIWLMGSELDGLYEWIGTEEHYSFYGKPALVRVSDLVGFDWKRADNDEWRNGEDKPFITADEALGLSG